MSEESNNRILGDFMEIKRFIYGSCMANSYVLSSEVSKSAVLFDCSGANDKILEYIAENQLILKAIFLTHGHFDHISGLYELREKTGARVYIYEAENVFLSDVGLNLADFDDSFKNEKMLDTADVLLNDGDTVKIDDLLVEVIHTPGHTTGCLCYKVGDSLFSGDTLFKQSIGRTDFPTGDYGEEISSIHRKLMVLDDNIKVYPGHGFSTTIGNERRENPYL